MKWLAVVVSAGALLAGQAPSFDVASVKPTPKERIGQVEDLECANGRLTTKGFPVSFLISWAYGLQRSRIEGLPKWAEGYNESPYDIEAKAAAPVKRDECRAMTRTLLAERFVLRAHTEIRTAQGLALVTTDGGAKLRRLAATEKVAKFNHQTLSDEPGVDGMSMDVLARILGGHPGTDFTPVENRTGLAGRWGFTLKFGYPPHPDDGPVVYTALKEQLGLKLERAKLQVEYLVVDHIERPTPD